MDRWQEFRSWACYRKDEGRAFGIETPVRVKRMKRNFSSLHTIPATGVSAI